MLMFVGICIFALFAGEVASAATTSAIAAGSIGEMSELLATDKLCTPYNSYIALYLKHLNVASYKHPSGTVMGCVEDLKAGKAKAVFLEVSSLKYLLRSKVELARSLVIVPGNYRMRLAPAFGNSDSGRAISAKYVNSKRAVVAVAVVVVRVITIIVAERRLVTWQWQWQWQCWWQRRL